MTGVGAAPGQYRNPWRRSAMSLYAVNEVEVTCPLARRVVATVKKINTAMIREVGVSATVRVGTRVAGRDTVEMRRPPAQSQTRTKRIEG